MIMMAMVAIATAAFAQSSIYIYRNDGNIVTIPDSTIQSMECSKVDSQMVTHTNYVMQIIKIASGDVKIPLSEIDSISFVKPVGNAVDLGLSVRWASYNVGANSSEEIGELYGWADPTGENTTNDVWDNNFTWISPLYGGVTPPSEISGTDYDIASMKWGGNWRMPTVAEVKELISKCNWTWTAVDNNIYGMKVTGPNGNSIFLPAAGHRDGSAVRDAGTKGYYWSGTLDSSDRGNAQSLAIDNGSDSISEVNRYMGHSVRPVSNQPIQVTTGEVTDKTATTVIIGGSVRGTTNAKTNVQMGIMISRTSPPSSSNGKAFAVSKTDDGTFSTLVLSLTDSTDYYYRAFLCVDGKYYYGSVSSFITPAYETAGELVDLGLSVKWASCNVGATSPEQPGKTCAWSDPAWNGIPQNFVDVNISGSPYDMARAKWGGSWRLPMYSEMKALIDSCEWTWMTFKGATGYKVTGPNGNSIFLPAPSGNNNYWSGTRTSASNPYIYNLKINKSSHEFSIDMFNNQFAVRPVQKDYPISVVTNSVSSVVQESAVVFYTVRGLSNPHNILKVGVQYGTTASFNSPEEANLTNPQYDSTYGVELDSLQSGTTYFCRGYMMIDGIYYYGETKSFTTKNSEKSGEAVDLGLSVKWANRNVGATCPEEYGGYYGWGDPTGTITSTNEADYFYFFDPTERIYGTKHDIASVKWGGNWRLPTQGEQQELVDKCTWTWTTLNGVNGCKVVGPNGNSIFLPASGYRLGKIVRRVGMEFDMYEGNYWSGEMKYKSEYASELYFRSDFRNLSGHYPYYGLSVRPVE
jgi:hypothetical protein